MKLTKKVVDQLTGKTKEARSLRYTLAIGLGVSEYWINQKAKQNKANSLLTTVTAVEILEKSLGMSQEEILEREPESEPVRA